MYLMTIAVHFCQFSIKHELYVHIEAPLRAASNAYSQTCLHQPPKIDKMKVLKTGGSLMQV